MTDVVDADITTRLGRSPWCILCCTQMPHEMDHPKEYTGWTYESARLFAVFYSNWSASRPDEPRPRVRIFSIPMGPGRWRYWAQTIRRKSDE